MVKVWKSKNIFSLGEISPNLFHRFDLAQYSAGLRKLKNGYAKIEGTVTNCPELETKQENVVTTAGGLKVFKYNVDDRFNYKGIVILIDGQKFKLLKLEEDNTLSFQKEFSAQYTEAEIKVLSIVQIENTVLICCKGKKPNMIRIDESNISSSVVVNYWEAIVDPPLKPIESIYQNKPSDPNVAEWNKSRFGNEVTIKVVNNTRVFSDTFLSDLANGEISLFGNSYRITTAKNVGEVSTFTCTAIDESGGLLPPRVNDKGEAVWDKFDYRKMFFSESIFSKNRYPSYCSYYQGRLVFANVQGNPDFICFSKTGNYFSFSGNVRNSDSGFTLAIPSDDRAIINNLISWNSLIITTNVGVWSSPIIQSITPTNSFLTRQMIPNFAEIEKAYTISNGALYYVNNFNNKVYTLLYNYDSKVYQAEEISSYSNFMLRKGIKAIEKMQYEGEEYILCELGEITEDEVVKYNNAMCTINRQQQVTSWNTYTLKEDSTVLNLDDVTLFFDNNNGVVKTSVLSYNIFKDDMEIVLLPPVLENEWQQIGLCPYIAKASYSYSNVKVSVIGDYKLDVNGFEKVSSFGADFELPYNIQFDGVMAGFLSGFDVPLTIKNKTNKKVEISAIYYTTGS
jgi:hypothetical protein